MISLGKGSFNKIVAHLLQVLLMEDMRREMEWKTKRQDGSVYEVRVTHFSKEFKFQFKDKGSEIWDYKRKPSPDDMETFLDNVRRRYQRRQATHEELERAEKMMADYLRD